MCIRIALLDVSLELVFWSRKDVTIYVRRGTSPAYAHAEISAILTDLGAPAAIGPRFTCYCGHPIPQTPGLMDAPTTTATPAAREALRYGA